MPPRSRTGCLTCRQRKLKCSEERPVCAQCIKANRECIPSSGITFRHQQNPSMNGDPVAKESLKSFYGYKETFNDQTVWVAIPRELTFVHTSNPYEDEDGGMNHDMDDTTLLQHDTRYDEGRTQAEWSLSQALYPTYATHGLEALSAVASQDQYSYAPPPIPMSHQELATHASQAEAASHHTTSGQSQNLDFILNPSAGLKSPSNIDPRLHTTPPSSSQGFPPPAQSPHHVRTLSCTSPRPLNLHSKGTRPAAIHDRELAFFMRDFSERAGCWMDIFDLDCFFGAHVAVLAVHCPILLHSCAALSAKSLARVNGRKPVMNGQTSRSGRSKTEHWPGPAMSKEDWIRKGRENYDIAISLLRQALAGASRPHISALPIKLSRHVTSAAEERTLPTTDSDELVAATAILCVYEFIDVSGKEWSQHLDGAKSLFDVAKDGMVPLVALPSSPIDITTHGGSIPEALSLKRPSQGRIAVFWNFARQDMMAAFINSSRTRLDTFDHPMWQSAGLRLTPAGKISPSNSQHPKFERDAAMLDDMICNALIWVLAKLVNFIATSEDAFEAIAPLIVPELRQQALTAEWNDLNAHLDSWYSGLTDSFHAAVVREADDERGIDEKWFPRSMCSCTMQSYHFARIQLQHHRPSSRLSKARTYQSVAARHAEYSTLPQQSRSHAREIVSIALGRADEGARVHSVQSLWIAGLVLGGSAGQFCEPGAKAEAETRMWRRTVVTLLRAIERDMGWAAEYRVQSLLEIWGLPHDWNVKDFGFTC